MKEKPIKLMLLGMTFMLLAIYLNLEEGLGQYINDGWQFFLVLVGFILSLIGFFNRN